MCMIRILQDPINRFSDPRNQPLCFLYMHQITSRKHTHTNIPATDCDLNIEICLNQSLAFYLSSILIVRVMLTIIFSLTALVPNISRPTSFTGELPKDCVCNPGVEFASAGIVGLISS